MANVVSLMVLATRLGLWDSISGTTPYDPFPTRYDLLSIVPTEPVDFVLGQGAVSAVRIL